MKFGWRGILICALHAVVVDARAQWPSWRGEGEWGSRGGYQRLYDPGAMETVRGEVATVDTFSLRSGGRSGVHLHVRRAKDTVIVHLGPLWFIENQGVALARGDSVAVRGSRVAFHGSRVIIAAEVIKGGDTLALRDAGGFPAWSAGRRMGTPGK